MVYSDIRYEGYVMSVQVAITTIMTIEEARDCVAKIRQNAEEMRDRLLDLHDRQGWRVLGYANFKACIAAEFRVSESRSYHLLSAARIDRMLAVDGPHAPIPERHARELAPVAFKPERVRQIHKDVVAKTNGHPTAQAYRDAVRPESAANVDTDRAIVVIDTLIRKLDSLEPGYMATKLSTRGHKRADVRRVIDWFTRLCEGLQE